MERAYKTARQQLTIKKIFNKRQPREYALLPSVGTIECIVIVIKHLRGGTTNARLRQRLNTGLELL